MAIIVVGCDVNNKYDENYQNTVCDCLEKEGHDVEKLVISHDSFMKYSYSPKANGKIGVYLMGCDLHAIMDYHYGANKNKESFIRVVFGIRGDVYPEIKDNGFDVIPIDEDESLTNFPNIVHGKSIRELNQILKEDTHIVQGLSCEDMANNIKKAIYISPFFTEKTHENIITVLKYYIPIKYWNLNNWDIIVKREEEVEKNIFKYKCSFYTLYFNEKLEPVEYGYQHIIDNKVYYDTSEGGDALAYLFLGYVNWYDWNDWGI